MGKDIQNAIDYDNLKQTRSNLNNFTGKLYKRQYEREIDEMDDKRLDEIQLQFLSNNKDLSFDDIRFVKRIFDFIKGEE